MTKDEFTAAYAEASEILVSDLLKDFIVMPCACDWRGCSGWAVINNSPLAIKTHQRLFAPEEKP